jgi:hypothetical protein
MNTSSVMVPRKVLEQSGSFDEQFKIGEDYDLWLRIARHHPMVYLDRVCCKYRIREDGLSGAIDVRGLRWLDAHIAVREKHRGAHWIPPEHINLLNAVLGDRYWELGWAHFGYNRLREARKCFWKVLEIYPLRLRIWLYWSSSFLPIPIIESMRKLKARIVARKAQSLQRTEA